MTETEMLPREAERNPIVFAKDGEVFANSRDVAAYFDKRHDNVLRDVDQLIAHASDLRDRQFLFVESPHPTIAGRSDRFYEMTRDGFTLLAMGFTGAKALRWKLKYIEAFNVMEAQVRDMASAAKIDVRDPAQLTQIAIQLMDLNKDLEGRVQEMTPKVQALDRIAESDGSFCITDAAKTLQVRPKDLFGFLRQNGWIYARPGGSEVAYQSKLAAGLLEHKTTTVHRSDGSEKTATQVRVTPRGLTRLAAVFPPTVTLV